MCICHISALHERKSLATLHVTNSQSLVLETALNVAQ